jgi:hypothetical protein
MTNAAKKQRNREYYLKNRERILTKAKTRKIQKRGTHLEIVPDLESEKDVLSAEDIAISEKDKNCQLAKPSFPTEISESAAVAEIFQPVSNAEKLQTSEVIDSDSSQADSASSQMDARAEILSASESGHGMKPNIHDSSSRLQVEAGPMEKRLKLASTMPKEHKVSCEPEQKSEDATPSKLTHLFSKIPLSFMLRLLMVLGLTILMTAMQVAFYREHDILPGYAVPLALASEVAFLSLVTMKFGRGLELLRVLVHLIFFVYFISALSFHVYAKSRIKSALKPGVTVSETTGIGEQLKQAERSLEVATKGRAWKNMEVFGAEVSRLRQQVSEIPRTQVLGTSADQTLWVEAILLILLRALLLAASALNALRLREQIYETTHCSTLVTQKMYQ